MPIQILGSRVNWHGIHVVGVDPLTHPVKQNVGGGEALGVRVPDRANMVLDAIL